MSKKTLFIMRHPPYGTNLAQEALEAVLAAGSFEQQVSVLFMDDGVLQLIEQQNPAASTQKNHHAMLKALPMYDVDQLFVDQHSLDERQLTSKNTNLPVALIDSNAIRQLMARHDHILSF